MMIESVSLSNFKTFREAHIDLRSFNVLVGANASGKSSFLSVFRFLRDISKHGLANAISLQGGVEYLRNVQLSHSEPLIVEIVTTGMGNYLPFLIREVRPVLLDSVKTRYRFALKFKTRGPNFDIIEDRAITTATYRDKDKQEHQLQLRLERTKKRNRGFEVEHTVDGVKQDTDRYPFSYFRDSRGQESALLLGLSVFGAPAFSLGIADIMVYDFDPKLPKRAVSISGKAELEENGENLAIVLKTLLESKEKRDSLVRLIHDLLPFMKSLNVERFADKSMLFKVRESYWGNRDLPASLLSDGTVSITAMLVALFFEDKPFVVLEEPERNIHPHLISRLCGVLREASRNRQVVVTTQSPELVKNAGLDSLILVSRQADGFSTISRPNSDPLLVQLLEQDMGLDELYVQGVLGKVRP